MRGLAIVLSMLILSAPARAEDDYPESIEPDQVREVGRGYELYFDRHGLRVRKGRRSAPLYVAGAQPLRGGGYAGVSVKVTRDQVWLSHMPGCNDIDQTFTHAQLEARLVLAEADRLRRRGDHEAAATTYARALEHDPALQVAERGAVRAWLALGRIDDAVAALGPRLAREPVAVYIDVARGGELAPLRDTEALTRLRPAVPGTVRAGAHGLTGAPILSSPGGWIANVEAEGSHGGCFAVTHLVVRDARTLAEVGRVLIGTPADHDGDGCAEGDHLTAAGRRRMAERSAFADRILAELGFAPLVGPGIEAATVELEPGRNVSKLKFAGARLGMVVGGDGAVRFFRDARLLAELPPGTAGDGAEITSGLLVPGEQRVLLTTFAFGCEWAEFNGMVSVPLPALP